MAWEEKSGRQRTQILSVRGAEAPLLIYFDGVLTRLSAILRSVCKKRVLREARKDRDRKRKREKRGTDIK